MSTEDWKRVRAILERAFELSGAERQRALDLECGADAALRAEVELLLAQESSAVSLEPPDPRAVMDSLRGDESDRRRRIGPYELERVIGSGGMGAVWLARRVGGDFEQRVAIKLIRRGMDTDDMLRRFARERSVLAGLEHPNIARLFDGGSTDDGRPFLVMEFVEGLPLDEHLREHALTLRERIELFLPICSAVGHAHQSLVVHRDLKPSNVLVSKDGTPKLLDFGIAKLLAPSGDELDEPTLTAQRILTPLYASPEQLRGERVTTQSDVYSLGVLLYELLSSARPFDATRKPDTEPLAPSRVSKAERRSLAGDLDTIVLKAMQPELARRYATVEQLAADLERYLDGLPVVARPDTWRYRATKFVRRNKVFVGAASIAIVSLVAGLATSTTMYFDARAQRVIADQRLASVLEIAASFTRDLGGRLAHLPGATAAREQMLRQAVKQLEALALEVPENARVQLELCWAYHDLATTLGSPSDSSLGRYDEALALLEKPVFIAEQLLGLDELDLDHALVAATTFRSRGTLRGMRGKFDDARADFELALSISRKALAGAPRDKEVPLILQVCGALKEWSEVQRAEKDFQGAQLLEEEQSAELTRACERHPGERPLLYLTGSSHFARGKIAQGLGDYPRAIAALESALESFEPLCALDPENSSYRRAQALVCQQLCDSLCSIHDDERAADFANRALVAWEEVVRRDPADDAAFVELVNFANKVGYTENFRHRLEASRVAFARALEVQEEVVRRHPEQHGRRAGQGFIMAELAVTLAELGRWREALELAARGHDAVLALENDPGRGQGWLYAAAMASSMLAECKIDVARDADWPASERRAQIEEALPLLDAARAKLLAARDAGELLPQNMPELETVEEHRKLAAEVLASLPAQ